MPVLPWEGFINEQLYVYHKLHTRQWSQVD